MGLFSKIAAGLRKTKDSFLGGLQRIFNSFTKIDEELFEELEEQMIMSDIGVDTSVEICDQLRKKVKERGITDPKDIMELIQEVIAEMMGDDTGLDLSVSPAVIMVIGVNGAGKTTTIGKLCYQFKNEGKKVLVAAADTFRAAAIDQLQVWTDRAGVDIVKHSEGSDPGAVVYDALEAAKARGCDVVIIDTAGRLHNKKNLMEELKKINRIIDNKAGECSREILLVLDATTGQNAVSQAKLFSETAPITGIVLTKLDGTAKGGIVISINNELGIPVKLIGVGEKIDDLQPFDSRMFVDALFDTPPVEDTDEEVPDSDDDDDENYSYDEEQFGSEAYDDDDAETEYSDDEEAEDRSDAEPEFEMPASPEPAFVPVDDEPENAGETENVSEPETVPAPAVNSYADDTAVTETEDEYSEDTAAEYEETDVVSGVENVDNEPAAYEDTAADDDEELEVEEVAVPEKKKKRGFFSRLFGRKDDNDDQ